MCHLRREANNIRTRRMRQEVWKDEEERRREGGSLPYILRVQNVDVFPITTTLYLPGDV